MKKRLLSALLALTMLLTLMPTAALAVETELEGDAGDIVWVTHEGIGSIEDVLPLPNTFGLGNHSTYNGSYFDQLDDESKAVYAAIYADDSPLKAGPVKYDQNDAKTYVSFNVACTSEAEAQDIILAAIAALLYDHPELSWLVNTQWSYGYSQTNEGTMTAITSFKLSDVGYKEATTEPEKVGTPDGDNTIYAYADTKDRAAIEAAINAAKGEIGTLEGKSDYEKVKAVHDWICGHMKYTDQKTDKFTKSWRGFQTAYSALVEKDTVCAGYAKSFKLLCDEYKIPCVIVTGDAGTGEKGPHAWNYVQLGGAWYAVDCTWDDQDAGMVDTYFLVGKNTPGFNNTTFDESHKNGSLYSTYAFAYPELSDEAYKDPTAPGSIELSYDPEADGTGTITGGGTVPAFTVPRTTSPQTSESKVITFTATLKDSAGKEITDQKVEWSLANAKDGVTLEPRGDNAAVLTILNSALSNYDDGNGPVVTVTAECSTTIAEQMLLIFVPKRVPTFVQIFKDEENVATDTTIAQGDSVTYTAKVYDQYGQGMEGQTVNWTVDSADKGVSVTNGKVTVSTDATAGTYTITASVGSETASPSASITVTVPAPHEHQWDEGKVTTPATCTQDGVKTFTCSVCKQTKTETIKASGHQYNTTWIKDETHHWHICSKCAAIDKKVEHKWGEGIQTKDPTCTVDGELTFTCSECNGTKTEPVVAGHKWNTEEWDKDNTHHWHNCTAANCPVTDNSKKDGYAAHTWDEGTVTKPATCTEAGEKKRTCTVCQQTKTETIPATGHKWSTEWKSDGTNHWHVCENGCTEISGKDAHTWNSEITKQPTCTGAGERTFTCAICGFTKTEEIQATGHSYSTAWEKDANDHWHICTVCKTPSEKTAHQWNAGVVTTQPTYTETGVKTITCTDCGQTKTETVVKKEHAYATTWSSNEVSHWHACTDEGFNSLKKDEAEHTWTKDADKSQDATADADGKNVYTCVCGKEKEETIGVTGHNYSTDWTTSETEHWHICTDSGCDKVSGKAPHAWTVEEGSTTDATHEADGSRELVCACGKKKTETLPKHTVSPLWSSDADKHWHACTVDSCTVKDSEGNHDWGEGTVTTPATLTAPGVKTYTCSVCNNTKQETIAQLEHTYSDQWSKDNDYHWHACTDEGYETLSKDKAPHTWDAGSVTKEPTEQATGVKTFTCTVCQQTKTETLPPLTHTHTWATDWSKDETGHWHACTSSTCTEKNDVGAHVYDDDADTTCNTCGYTRTVTPAPGGFTITFNANGGTVTPATANTVDGKLTSLPTPTRSGYTFDGWFTMAEGGNQVTTDTVFSANATIYAHWTVNSSGGSSGGGSSSSTVKVPVSGDNNSVQVSASVSGTTATISGLDTKQLDTVAGEGGKTGMVEVDLTGLKQTIRTVELPADTLKEIAKAAADENNGTRGLTIKLPAAEASFDAAALDEIQKQASSKIALTIAPASSSALNARQKETVGNAPVFDLTMKSGSKTITDFGGGYATISVPYELAKGQDPAGIVVYYLDNSGNIHACETMYDVRTGRAIFTTGHLSLYFVGYAPENLVNFADVASGAYYYDAVVWAVANGITKGTSATAFSPDLSCTRAQTVTFLWRAAGSPAPKSSTNPFTDVKAGAYYYDAVLWAVEQGITKGTGADTFSPDATVTRGQTVTFLYRAAGSPAVDGSSSFGDVASDAYYSSAVQWAVANGITKGTSASAFSPDSDCTRAQIVTFLYRSQSK